jgi:inositol transport system substrate-binding protein
MKSRSLIAFMMLLCLLFSLVACSPAQPAAPAQESAAPAETQTAEPPAAPADEKKTIAFCVADADDQWLSYLYDEANNFAKENKDEFDFVFGDARNDLNEQISIVENWIMSGVDAIVVNPYDSEATGPIIDMCKEAGVFVVSVNRPFANQQAADCGVYGDSKQSGVMEMEYLAEKLGHKGKIAVFMGVESQEAAILRTDGFEEVIAKYPDMEVVFKQSGNWNRDEGMALMEDLLQSGQEVNAIASNNDEMAIGAYLALQAAGNKDIIVGGIDASPDALQYLSADGQYVITVFQDAKGQAYGAMGAAADLLRGKPVEKEILISYELVTPDKRDDYLKIWGVA